MPRRVLIVDDEWRTLQGEAQRVARCGLDVEVVGLALNAHKALDLVREKRPDIVLCDIHMPDMDGIAFAIAAKELDPHLAVIFISGYSDKEYLRTAIRLGVVDYLFKPVDDTEFLAAMTRAIEQNGRRRAEGQTKPTLIDQALLGRLLHSNDEAILRDITPQPQGNYIVLYAACCAPRINDLARQQLHMFALHMMSTLSQMPGLRYTTLREAEAVVLLVSQDAQAASLEMTMQSACESMFESVPEARELLAIGIGGQYERLVHTSRSFAEATRAHRLTFFRGAGAVILHSRRGVHSYLPDEAQVLQITEAIEKHHMLAARDQVDDILMRIKVAEATPTAAVMDFAGRVTDALEAVYARQLPGRALFQPGERAQWFSEIITLGGLQQKLQSLFTRVADDTLLGSGGQNAVYNARHYIWANIGSDLSIKAIAQHVYLSPTYFCALFKNVSGETVNQYIQRVRIERAKRYLDEGELSVSEIARAVGYQNSRYFAKIFASATGRQPSAYRKRLRHD